MADQQHLNSSLPDAEADSGLPSDTPSKAAPDAAGEEGSSSATTTAAAMSTATEDAVVETSEGDASANADAHSEHKKGGRIGALQRGEGSASSPFLTRSTGEGLGHLEQQDEENEQQQGKETEGAVPHEERSASPIPTPTTPVEESEEDRIILGPSTLNPETGKRVYSQDFLLLFQQLPTCREKPEGLLEIDDIIPGSGKPKAQGGRSGPGSMGPRGARGAASGSSWKTRSQGSGGGRGNVGGGKPPLQGASGGPKIWRESSAGSVSTAASPSTDTATDNKNVWQRPRKVEGNDKIFKEIKGILNKLTLEKFQPLSDQLIGLLGQVTDVSMLDQVINQIFDKALTEPQFSKMYAELCLKVQPACPEFEDNGKKQNFRRLLLNRCQKEFEKKTQLDEDADTPSPEDKELREAKAKTRMFGNIIFIGELFKLRMLTDKIMHGCVIVTLLPPVGQGQPSHEDLEALCKLMSTVGKQLDAKTRGKSDSPMEQYFRRLTEMAEDKNHPARIRFMLTDLIDMRRNGWVGVGADDTPKTLEEVHKSLAKEEAARAGRGPAPPAGARGAPVARPAAAAAARSAHAATGGAPGTTNNNTTTTKGSADGWEVVGGSKGARGGKAGRGGASAPTKGEWETVSNSAKGRGGGSGGGGGGRGGRGSSRGTDAPSARGGGRGGYVSQRGGGRGAAPADRSRKGGKEAGEALPVNPFSLLSAESEGKEKAESVDNKKGARPAGEVYVPSHRRRQQAAAGEDKEAKKATEAVVVPAKATPALSEEKIKQLDNDAEMLLEEYILSYDELEAGECIKELKAPEYHYKVVSKAVAKAIERKEEQRKLISKLLFQLHTEQNVLSAESIAQGFADVLQAIEEVDVDSPKASSYLGNLIGQAVLDEILPLSFLNSGLDHLIASGKALKIASEAFRIIADRTNPEEMGIMCKESGLDFMRFLPEENRNLDYLSKYLREQVNVDMGLLVPSS